MKKKNKAIWLKSECPFCGNEAKIIPTLLGWYYKAGCETAHCRGWINTAPAYETEEDAEIAWEKRPMGQEERYEQAFDSIVSELKEEKEIAAKQKDSYYADGRRDGLGDAMGIINFWRGALAK